MDAQYYNNYIQRITAKLKHRGFFNSSAEEIFSEAYIYSFNKYGPNINETHLQEGINITILEIGRSKSGLIRKTDFKEVKAKNNWITEDYKCTKCKEYLPISEFGQHYIARFNNYHRNRYCKKCNSENARDWEKKRRKLDPIWYKARLEKSKESKRWKRRIIKKYKQQQKINVKNPTDRFLNSKKYKLQSYISILTDDYLIKKMSNEWKLNDLNNYPILLQLKRKELINKFKKKSEIK